MANRLLPFTNPLWGVISMPRPKVISIQDHSPASLGCLVNADKKFGSLHQLDHLPPDHLRSKP
eukprot:526077-Hanusia_phi.AAC.2